MEAESEEELIYLDFPEFDSTHALYRFENYKIIGLDTLTPCIRLGDFLFEGEWLETNTPIVFSLTAPRTRRENTEVAPVIDISRLQPRTHRILRFHLVSAKAAAAAAAAPVAETSAVSASSVPAVAQNTDPMRVDDSVK